MKRLEKNINMFEAKHEHVFEKHEHVLAASPQCFSRGFTVAGKPVPCCKQLSRDEIFGILKERM